MNPKRTRPDCTDPAFLQEGELLAFASSPTADPGALPEPRRRAIQAHLQHCAHCAEEVAELTVWSGLLPQAHEAGQCPSPLSLLSFSAGLMPSAERMPLASHLLRCPDCQQALVALDQASGLDPASVPAPPLRAWWKVLSDAVQPLVSRLFEAVPAQAVAVRGDGPTRTLLFRGSHRMETPEQRPEDSAPSQLTAPGAGPGAGPGVAPGAGPADATEIVLSWLPPEPPDDHWVVSGQLIASSLDSAALDSAALETDDRQTGALATAAPAVDVLFAHDKASGNRIPVDEFGFFTAAVTDPKDLTLLVFFPEHIVEIGPFTLT